MVNKKVIFMVFGIIIILILAFIFLKFTNQNNKSGDYEKKENNLNNNILQQTNPQITDIVIITNPINLSYFSGITKFRSCFGHEFGFTSAFEGKEAKSSLKHYFVFKDEYFGKDNSIPVYSAFDGIVLYTETEQILIQKKPFNGWIIDFNHVILKEGLKIGSEVKVGEFLGYADTKDSHALDISLQAKNKSGFGEHDWYNSYESIFNHMSDEVYKDYTDKGINKENMIILKATRDSSPCPCDNTQPPYPNSPYCPFPPIPFDSEGNGVSF